MPRGRKVKTIGAKERVRIKSLRSEGMTKSQIACKMKMSMHQVNKVLPPKPKRKKATRRRSG